MQVNEVVFLQLLGVVQTLLCTLALFYSGTNRSLYHTEHPLFVVCGHFGVGTTPVKWYSSQVEVRDKWYSDPRFKQQYSCRSKYRWSLDIEKS